MPSVILIVGLAKQAYQKAGYDVIGVDHGASVCAKNHLTMNYAIADFDSCTEDEMQAIQTYAKQVITLPRCKNETDTEYAVLYALEKGYDQIEIYGGLGGRIDHEIANLALLIHRDYPITLVDEQNVIKVLKKGSYQIKKQHQYLSFFALEDSEITLSNVQYPLDKQKLTPSDIYTISNEFIDDLAMVTIHHGRVLCIQASDAKAKFS